jgi:hypothetical protein
MHTTTNTELATKFAWELGIQLNVEDNTEYLVDKSNYRVVDGEEGDYGETLYYLNNKLVTDINPSSLTLICKYVNYGGDDYDYFFTETGADYLYSKIVEETAKRKAEFTNYLKQ